MEIYTLGYQNKSFQEFLKILEDYQIELVVDVRSYPESRFSEFTKDNLKDNLEIEGFSYLHLPKLGGLREESYREFMETESFKKSIDQLMTLAKKNKTVIICLESYPNQCHRRYVSQKLKDEGWTVNHLIKENQEKQNTLI